MLDPSIGRVCYHWTSLQHHRYLHTSNSLLISPIYIEMKFYNNFCLHVNGKNLFWRWCDGSIWCDIVRWVVGSILHGGPLSYFSFQPVFHDWCSKGHGMCYVVCGMMHIKEPLLLIGKSSPCGSSGFPLSLFEWSFTICPTPCNSKYNVLSASLNKTFPFFLACGLWMAISAEIQQRTTNTGRACRGLVVQSSCRCDRPLSENS